MKIKALIATLVLGSSSLAFADRFEPSYTPPAPAVRDHRQLPAPMPAPAPVVQVVQQPVAQPQYGWHKQERPLLLANDTHLSGRALIKVPTSNRAFTKLELTANNGRTTIERVLITFGNGQRQVVNLNGTVAGKQSLSIDLDGRSRQIKSITLIGSSMRRASIDVVAV